MKVKCTQTKFFFEMSSCSCWLPESSTGMTVWVSRILPSATAAMRSRIRRWDPPLGDGNCFALETGISTVEFQQQKSRKGGDFKMFQQPSLMLMFTTTLWSFPIKLFLTWIDWGRFKMVYQPVNSSYQTTMTTSSCHLLAESLAKHDPGELQFFAPAWVKWVKAWLQIYRGSPYININWCSPEYRKTIRKNVVQ